MKYDISIWNNEYISSKAFAEWTCTICYKGALKIYQVNISKNKDSFVAIFQCTNNKCEKQFTSCGKVTFWDEFNEVSSQYLGNKYLRYYPLIFIPELEIFKIPNQCNKEVKVELLCAFKLFWSDFDSTLNSLRRSLEYLLNQIEIPPKNSLHKRLNEFSKIHPDLKELIHAIKLMGNIGSHTKKDKLNRSEVLKTLQIYNLLLSKLFPDGEEGMIRQNALQIVKNMHVKPINGDSNIANLNDPFSVS